MSVAGWAAAMKRLLVALAISFALPASAAELPSASVNFPDPMALDDALRLFRQRGLDLLIAEAAIWNAEGDVKVAGAIPNPNLAYTFEHIFNYDPNGTCPQDPANPSAPFGSATCSPNVHSLTLGDNAALFDSLSGKRGLRLKVARRALEAAKMARADAQRTLEFLVKQQYIQSVLARDSLDFALEVQKSATQTFELNTVRYNAGAISEADVAKVETAKLEADQAVDTAAQALRVAKVGLAFLLGVRGPVPDFHVAQDLPKFRVPPSLSIASRDSLLDQAVRHRPDLRGMEFQRQRAQASITLAKRMIFPDLQLMIGFNYAAPGGFQFSSNTTPPTLIVGISGNLPLFYQQQGEINKAEADFRTQDVTRAKAEAQVVSDVETAWTNFLSSRKLVERMETRLLDRAKRARDLVEIQFRKGAASLLEYLDAQRTYISTNVEYLQDLTNYWTAVYQLEQAVGTDLR
jgi:cobalt-zinc-cadmium efflux system outer membrane protein